MVNLVNTLKKSYEKYHGRINIWFMIFAMLFSVMLVVSCHIFRSPAGASTIESVYVTDFHFVDAVMWLFTVPAIYLLMKGAAFIFKALGAVFFKEQRRGKAGIWVFGGSFLLLMVLWFPYLPSYWPGGIYSDTVDSINMALGKAALDNHNPILYTLIWRLMFRVTGAFTGAGEYGGLKLFTVVQTVLMAIALSGFVAWCYKKGLHKNFTVLCLLIFGLLPLYPFYGISLWKDTLFSLVVFIFSVFLYHVFGEGGEDISWLHLTLYGLLSILIIFLRNNGIYIAVFYSVIISITAFGMKWTRTALKVGGLSAAIIIIAAIIQGPVYDSQGYNFDRARESLGIPLQQVAYIVSTDGVISEEDMEVIGVIMPLESWKALYCPEVVDTIKFDPGFNGEYLENHTGEFMKTYLHLIGRNPVKAGKAYLLATMGFWDVFESSSTAYVCNFHFGNAEYFMSDYFDYYLNISFRNLVEPKNYISAAVWVWMMLATIFICLAKRNYKGLIAVMPALGLWLSIMIATPVAFSFRYVYALFLSVPLYLIICLQSFKE